MKKKIALILACLLFVQVAFAATYDGGKVKIAPADWENYKASHGLGPEVTLTSNGKSFNKELFEELGLVVYGDHSLISGNDFKAKSGGYYNKNGVVGEYRYHGYDLNGNKHGNDNFPRDSDTGTPPEKKYWVFRPWMNTSFGYNLFKKHIGNNVSNYNKWAIEGDQAVAKLINEGLPFDINETYEAPNGDKNPINYISVQTMPTTFSSGQGTMIHKSVYDGRAWYQSFVLNRATSKKMIPVVAKIPQINVVGTSLEGNVVVRVRVTGFLDDTDVWGDEQKMAGSYHRKELKAWSITLNNSITGELMTKAGTKSSAVEAYADFEITMPQDVYESQLLSDKSFNINFVGTAKAIFGDNKSAQDDEHASKKVKGTEQIIIPPIDNYRPPRPEPIEFDVNAPIQILDRWAFNLNLNVINATKAIDRYVELDGKQLSEAEEISFLSGNYRFPILGESKVYDYKIVYVHQNSDLYFYQGFVVVHDSIPYVSVRVVDPGKVNRKVSATFDTSVTNIFVRENSTVQIKSVTAVSQEGNQIYYGANTRALIEFMQKQTGTVDLTVVVGNEYGDRTVKHSIYAGEDHAPDITAMIWNNYLSRSDQLDLTAEGASLDDDTVASLTYEIFYDANKDGIAEQSIKSGNFDAAFNYAPTQLGSYKIVFTAVESFGQPTIPQHITAADYKKTVVEREFFVENLIPMTKLYSDVEYKFPELNVALIIDQGVPRPENDYIKTQQVQLENQFRLNSMVADLDVWDTFTYVFTQTAYSRVATGGSYPPAQTSYSNGGFVGTLNRYNVDNYSYSQDNGSWQTRTLSKTVTMTKDNWGISGTDSTRYSDGSRTDYTYYWATYSYNSDGWSGSTSGSGSSWTSYDKNGKVIGSGSTNQPTMSGTAYKSETYWQSNIVYYDDYYGDYSGPVSKNVKQTYNPTYATNSTKYIVYMTSGAVNNIADLNYVKNIARDAKLIVIGPANIKGTLGEKHFITYSTNTQSLLNQVVDICRVENPIANEFAILVNQTINFSHTDLDEEGDPIVEQGFQFVHDPSYFDNAQGLESGAYATYAANQYSTATKSSFSKPGKYEVYRRIKDAPVGYESKGEYSNLAKFDLVVHRPPIASATLDWDFDGSTGVYKTTWVDKSYDPDFQYRDAQRGVVDRKIKYKLSSASTWIYEIPNNLSPGTYNLEYVVMDKHGVWSAPFTMNFTLSAVPTIQLSANIKSQHPDFTPAGIPVTERLELFNVWTRYPYQVRLEASLYNAAGTARVGALQTINFTQGSTGSKTGNDINWNNILTQIPSNFADTNYILKLRAFDPVTPSNTVELNFPITVKTPHDLKGYINGDATASVIYLGEVNEITAETSIYVQSVTANVLSTNVPLTYVSTVGNKKQWRNTITVNESIGETTGVAVFTSTTINAIAGTYANGGKIDVDYVTRMPLEITGTITPNPSLAGERVSIVCNTKGRGESVVVNLNSVESGRTLNLVPTLATSTMENTFKGTYVVPLDTDDGTYPVTATVYRMTAFGMRSASTQMNLVVRGNMFQLIKPEIKDGN